MPYTRHPILADPDRLAAVAATGLLDAPAEESFDRLVRMATKLVDAPVAVVALVTDRRHTIVSQSGLGDPAPGTQHGLPLDLAPCRLVVETGAPLMVSDIRDDLRCESMASLASAGIVSYLGVPLRTRDGTVIGSVAALGPAPKAWNDDDLRWLNQLGEEATDQLELRANVVSALRDGRELLTRLAAQVPGVIYQHHRFPDGRFNFPYASAALKQIYGISPEEVREDGSAVYRVIHPEDRDALIESMRRSAAELTRWQHEFRTILPEQGVQWRRGIAQPERLEDGSTLWHGFVTDITAERAERQAREELESQLQHARKMEAVGTLAGGIAHDFNNVLAGILSNVELARDDLPDEHPARASLDDAYKAARRARSLVAQMLDFSHRRAPARTPTVLWPVLDEAWHLIRATLPEGIVAEASCDDMTATVLADPTQIHQVVMNLCTNAVHAMGAGPGRLVLRAQSVVVGSGDTDTVEPLPAGPYLRITVGDTGAGMSEETRRRIFEPFFTTRAKGQGTGLGLAMVYAIVKHHQGGVAVTSKVGVGTSMHIYLPLIAVSEEPAGTTPATEQAPSTGTELRSRVLVVDDEEIVGRSAERTLRRLGYSPTVFSRARDALDWMRADPSRVDVVITDLAMPEMDGLEFAAALRALRPNLPIIYCSGLLEDSGLSQPETGAVEHLLVKPFTKSDVAEALGRLGL